MYIIFAIRNKQKRHKLSKQFYNILNKGSKAEVRIYGEIWYYGEGSSRNLSNKLTALSKDHDEITLKINSGGGSVIEAVAIYNIIKNTDAKIIAVIEGIAASAMSFIIMACDEIVMGKATRIMTHKLRGGLYGTSKAHRDSADMMDSWEEDIYKLYADRTGMSVKKVKNTFFIEGQDVWLSPTQCLKYGLVDKIEEGAATKEPDNTVTDVHNAWQFYETQITNNSKTEYKMKNVIKHLGLPENATEDQVIEAIEKSKAPAATPPATPAAETKPDTELQNKYEALVNSRAEELVNNAIAAGQIKAEKKDTWLKMAKDNYEGAQEALNSIAGRPNANEKINPKSGAAASAENRSEWTVEDYLKKDPEALEALKESDENAYNKLIAKSY